ncbi:interferon lambda receptor 1 [Melanerpes formicivorus]|uniref:interferon lambda receptor 1 n=1 Tax=Melanerpes formicivorus TaxID=211600 RepID=UPI00358FA0C3
MSSWRAGVLTALCLLQQAGGQGKLPAPQNVTLLSRDFDMILTWAPGAGSPPGVRYTVRYESLQHLNKWKKVPHCKAIESTSCKLTCELPTYFVKARAQVKAVLGSSQSPWVVSQFKEYYLDVELAPPVLNVTLKDNSIHVEASFPLPPCVETLVWMYDLNFWEAGSEEKKQYEKILRKQAVTIDTTALRGNYCLSARSSFQGIGFKYSHFSQPQCVLLTHRGQWKFPFAVTIPVFVLPIFLTTPFLICLLKQDAKQKKMPHALDLSPLKAAGADFHCELSTKEFSRACLTCTELPESQGKTAKASARNSLPRMASFLSSSSEEEEGSSTFIPYIGMPHFPKRPLNPQPSRTYQGKSSLDSGTGDLSVGSESELDLSTLDSTFFPLGKSEVDTSGSQASEKSSLSHSSSLGRISLTDVRFPGSEEHGQQDTGWEGCLDVTPLQTLAEGTCATLAGAQHGQAPHFTRYYQRAAELHLQLAETAQLQQQPSSQLLLSFQTLQGAEDEGIASDCERDTLAAGTFETSGVEGKHSEVFRFKGYERAHYLGRS